MPASKKVTKEDIVNAAFEVMRDGGFGSVNARSVAKKLGCSTQPIYLSFQSMDELKSELTQHAMDAHTEKILASIRESRTSRIRYLDYGIGFIRFAEQEKELFRWLYLSGGQAGYQMRDIHLPDIIRTISEDFGYTEEVSQHFHEDMIYYSYGIAILLNTGSISLDDNELIAALQREFKALTAIYGEPKNKDFKGETT